MKRVVVTGGAGFIGSHVVEQLLARGNVEVIVVDTFFGGKREDRLFKSAQYHEVDVRNTDALVQVCSGADTVFHLAAIPRVPYSIENPVETTDYNITGTVSALTAATRAGVQRFIYSSSGSAYGNQETLPLSENLPASPVNPYGLQKYAGELFVSLWPSLYALETVSLRYFNVYGPRLDPEGPYALAVGAFLLAKKDGRPLTIFGDGTITRDYTHVFDVARANLVSAESERVGRGEVINIGAGRNVTIQYLAELINGGKEGIRYAPPRVEAHDSQADNTRARELLGWGPDVSLEEGIAMLKKEFGLT